MSVEKVDAEYYHKDMIRKIFDEAKKRAQPHIDALVALESMKPANPIYVDPANVPHLVPRLAVFDARTLAVLRDALEPLLRFHETGGHEGDGSDERLAVIRAALNPEQASTPEEEVGKTWIELPPLTDDQREYLERILAQIGRHDPKAVIGGPRTGDDR